MGGSQSVEIPGGGSEGYHVLRVSVFLECVSWFLPFTHAVHRVSLAAQSSNRGRGCQCGLLTEAKC